MDEEYLDELLTISNERMTFEKKSFHEVNLSVYSRNNYI
jgi:hypothetical protein